MVVLLQLEDCCSLESGRQPVCRVLLSLETGFGSLPWCVRVSVGTVFFFWNFFPFLTWQSCSFHVLQGCLGAVDVGEMSPLPCGFLSPPRVALALAVPSWAFQCGVSAFLAVSVWVILDCASCDAQILGPYVFV